MTLVGSLRPVLTALLGLTVVACGAVDAEAPFETMAQSVADVPLGGGPRRGERGIAAATARDAGLRPAVRVEVMTPHELWDARDGILRPAIEAVPEVSMPTLAVAERVEAAEQRAAPSETRTIQLGAYGSPAAAQAAWARLSKSQAGLLTGLDPRFETVRIEGKELVRLRLSAPVADASALCAAVAATDPWCSGQS